MLVGCLFVNLSPFKNCLVHKKMVVDCILVIKAIGKKLLPDQTRPGKGMIGPDSLLHSRHSALGLVHYPHNIDAYYDTMPGELQPRDGQRPRVVQTALAEAREGEEGLD